MAKIRARLFGMAAAMILSACATGAQAPTQSSGAGAIRLPLSGLPATFKGTLPCADCAGIDYQLNLNPDHTFAHAWFMKDGMQASETVGAGGWTAQCSS